MSGAHIVPYTALCPRKSQVVGLESGMRFRASLGIRRLRVSGVFKVFQVLSYSGAN